jgi:hypothetical protein
MLHCKEARDTHDLYTETGNPTCAIRWDYAHPKVTQLTSYFLLGAGEYRRFNSASRTFTAPYSNCSGCCLQ